MQPLVLFSIGRFKLFKKKFITRRHLRCRFFNNEGCLGAGVETLLSGGTLLIFLAFARSGVAINSILMIITGALNCGADIILCQSIDHLKDRTCLLF